MCSKLNDSSLSNGLGFELIVLWKRYFAIGTGVGEPSFAFYLISIMNAAGLFGRIGLGQVADKVKSSFLLVSTLAAHAQL